MKMMGEQCSLAVTSSHDETSLSIACLPLQCMMMSKNIPESCIFRLLFYSKSKFNFSKKEWNSCVFSWQVSWDLSVVFTSPLKCLRRSVLLLQTLWCHRSPRKKCGKIRCIKETQVLEYIFLRHASRKPWEGEERKMIMMMKVLTGQP